MEFTRARHVSRNLRGPLAGWSHGIRIAALIDMGRASASSNVGREKSLVAAMLQPAFYPSPPEEVFHKETHISHVFLAGDLVYKIKKGVKFPFLDFSTAAKRRHFLEAELRLNRRLAPAVYLGIVPIFQDSTGWSLEGKGRPHEHALLMRRLPEKRMLDYLLKLGGATIPMMEELAKRLAAFHRSAERVITAPEEHLAKVRANWDKNLLELEPLLPDDDHRDDLAAIGEAGRSFQRENAEKIARRGSGGWVRDVHGDLHAEHICFAPEGIEIFDCIEFSDELRRCDLASELAFLLMDLSARGGERLVQPFLECYLGELNDPDLAALLPFYECHRALVRAKVHALRLGRWNDEAARYFHLAQRLRWHAIKPFLLLVSGFTGSGKSTLARQLGKRLGAAVLNSDAVRKRLAGKQGREAAALNEGIYGREMTERTYDTMAHEAESSLQSGAGVIVDATLGERRQRVKFIRLADRTNVPLCVIRCTSSDEVSSERLRARAEAGKDISDGRWEVYVAQKAAFEPMDEIDADLRMDLCTEAPVQSLVRNAEAFLWRRLRAKAKADPSSLRSSGGHARERS